MRERHMRFHSQQLRPEFAALPPWARLPVSWAWQRLVIGTACVVVLNHGPRSAGPFPDFVIVVGPFRGLVTTRRGTCRSCCRGGAAAEGFAVEFRVADGSW